MTQLPIPENLSSISCFSSKIPGMQLAIDAYSLEQFKICPRKYYYQVVWGYQTREMNAHLQFGIWLHEGLETYDRTRAAGADHEEAIQAAVHKSLVNSWNKELQRPWISDESTKTRVTLIRSIIWYLDHFGANDILKTEFDANGQPLVEMNFALDSGFFTDAGERLLLAGYGDKIASIDGDGYWVDRKTTKRALDDRYFAQFKPHNQFGLYNVVGKILFQKPLKGMVLDALQVGVNFTRMRRKFILQDEHEAEEWLEGFAIHAHWMEECASERQWPMRESSCDMYFGCSFRKVCSKSPASRQMVLDSEFVRRRWNPLEKRIEI